MKVLHVLNSRVYSGAEKVASQIIKEFEAEMEIAYCSPESDMVAQMLAEQNIRHIPIRNMLPWNLKKVLREEKPDLIHAHDMRATFVSALCCGKIPLIASAPRPVQFPPTRWPRSIPGKYPPAPSVCASSVKSDSRLQTMP